MKRSRTPAEHVLFGPPKYRRATLIRNLKKKLGERTEHAFLFGSYARGNAHTVSDVDVVLVVRTTRPFVERFRDYLDVVNAFSPMDLIVYTPEEWERLMKAPPPFWAEARKSWVPLGERKKKKAVRRRKS